MAYRKRSGRKYRKGRSKRKAFSRKIRRGGKKSFNKAVVRAIRSTAEKKRKIDGWGTAITNVWHMQHVSNITQGTAEDQRIGNTVTQTKLVIKAKLFLNTNPTTLNNQVRFMVVQAKKPYSSSAIDMSEILNDTGNPIISFYAREKIKGWNVLLDEVIVIDLVNTSQSIHRKISLKNRKQSFAGASFTDCTYGDVYILIITDNGLGEVTWNGKASFYYIDY